jgi:hypothetical protein
MDLHLYDEKEITHNLLQKRRKPDFYAPDQNSALRRSEVIRIPSSTTRTGHPPLEQKENNNTTPVSHRESIRRYEKAARALREVKKRSAFRPLRFYRSQQRYRRFRSPNAGLAQSRARRKAMRSSAHLPVIPRFIRRAPRCCRRPACRASGASATPILHASYGNKRDVPDGR